MPVHAVPGQGRHLPEAVEALLEARSDPDRLRRRSASSLVVSTYGTRRGFCLLTCLSFCIRCPISVCLSALKGLTQL